MLFKSSVFMFWEFAFFTEGAEATIFGVGVVDEDWTLLLVAYGPDSAAAMVAASSYVISDVFSSSKEIMIC